MMLFVCQNVGHEIRKFGQNLPLATFGRKGLKQHVTKESDLLRIETSAEIPY